MNKGIANLLESCIDLHPGQRLLIVEEPAHETLYDPLVTEMVAQYARAMGASVAIEAPALVSDPADFPAAVSSKMRDSDHTLFLSRIGDYARFTPMAGDGSKTICYAHEPGMFRSLYAGGCHRLMSELLARLENELRQAGHWHISCELGTDLSGEFHYVKDDHRNEFSMSLFPVTTFNPVTCESASGNVALSRWLMPGAATKVGPPAMSFNGIVNARIQAGLIEQFEGDADSVQQISDYYDLISGTLGVRRDRVHSWHAGINPQTSFRGPIEQDFDGWIALSFASPRYLHFHTCGDIPPGEIAWSVFNPTVTIDDVPYWQNGEFCWLHRQEIRRIIIDNNQHHLLEPSSEIGI